MSRDPNWQEIDFREYRLTRIPPVLWGQVKRIAHTEGCSVREGIMRLLDHYVKYGFPEHPLK